MAIIFKEIGTPQTITKEEAAKVAILQRPSGGTGLPVNDDEEWTFTGKYFVRNYSVSGSANPSTNGDKQMILLELSHEEKTANVSLNMFVSREVYGFAEANNGSIESVRSSIKVTGAFANGTLPIDIFNGINKDDKFICHKTAYAKTADSNMISHLISFERK